MSYTQFIFAKQGDVAAPLAWQTIMPDGIEGMMIEPIVWANTDDEGYLSAEGRYQNRAFELSFIIEPREASLEFLKIESDRLQAYDVCIVQNWGGNDMEALAMHVLALNFLKHADAKVFWGNEWRSHETLSEDLERAYQSIVKLYG